MDRPLGRSSGVNDAVVDRPAAVELPGKPAADSFESLYERTFERVYAYAASLLRDRAAAEDVTAQAFERAYRKRRRYRASRGSAEAWLFGIVRNAALDELRRRKRRASLHGDPKSEDHEAPVDFAERAIRRETLRGALATLTAVERDIVALKFAGGLTNAEIARVLRTSESNAGTRLHRTMTKLREACHDDV
jgi:RNA polymerase sigma-70 factor (ECF subfamily)